MATTKADVPTAHGEKYLKQLCSHWSHKLEIELEDGHGIVRFPEGVADMRSSADGLFVTIEADSAEVLDRLKGVVASHLDRFAFREAPLTFNWS